MGNFFYVIYIPLGNIRQSINFIKKFSHKKYTAFGLLQIDTKKLQIKYNFLKKKWRGIKDHPRSGSGLAPQDLPAWYSDLDLVLYDTNTGLEDVVSEPVETSYGQDVLENENENESTDEELDEEVLNDNSELAQSQESIIRKKIVVKPHQKKKSNKIENTGFESSSRRNDTND